MIRFNRVAWKNVIFLFLFAIFLTKFPPFYYLQIPNRLFSTHTLAKIIFLFIFFYAIFTKKNFLNNLLKKKVWLILLSYFIAQSVSVLSASSIVFFWKAFHNVIIILIIFFISSLIISINKEVIKKLNLFIIICGYSLILLELLFLFFPNYLLDVFKVFLQREVMDAYMTDLNRGRQTLTLQLEIFIPFLLFNIYQLLSARRSEIKNEASLISPHTNEDRKIRHFLIKEKQDLFKGINNKVKVNILCLLILIGLIIFFAFTSNYRARVIISAFSLLTSLTVISFIKKSQQLHHTFKYLTKILFMLIIIFVFLGINISNAFYSFNIFDRFAFKDEYMGVTSIKSRLYSWQKSIDFFKSSPFIGIGLGNYFDYPDKNYVFRIQKDYQKKFIETSAYSPHNIFFQIIGETGVIGIVTFFILIGYFLFIDIKIIKKGKQIFFPFIISSWTAFMFMNVEPATTIFTNSLFWLFRGVISAAE